MAFSQREFSGNGATSQFEIPFLFISPEDIRVSLNEEPLVFEQDYEIIETDQGFFVDFYEAPLSGDVGMIYRMTSPEKRLVQWRAPSPFKEDDLNLEANQFLFRLQELTDRVDTDGFLPFANKVVIDDEEISKTLLEDSIATGSEASSLIADLETYTEAELDKVRADVQGVQDQAQSDVQSARDNLESQIEDTYNTLQDAIDGIESDLDPAKYATKAELEENYYTFEQVDAAIAAKETQLTSQLTDGVLDGGFWSDDGVFFEEDEWTDFSNDVRFVEATLDQSYMTIAEVDQSLTALETSLTSEYQTYVDNELDNYYTKATIDNDFYTKASADQAIAAQIQSFDAEVEGGLKASVETHKSAIAELDDFASAFASVTVDTEGGGIAGFRAVSYEDADGSGSSALELLGDQVVIPGSLTTKTVKVTDGSGNLVVNGDFRTEVMPVESPPDNWTVMERGGESETAVDNMPAPYALRMDHEEQGSYQARDITDEIPVEPGDEFYWSVEAAAGGHWEERDFRFAIRPTFYDASGDEVHYSWNPFETDSSSWEKFEGHITAPAGAVSLVHRIALRDGGTHHGYLTKIRIRRKEEGTTSIKPGSVTTEEIDTDDFNANGMAVFGGTLQSDNFQAGLQGWRIRKEDAEFGTLEIRDNSISAMRATSASGPFTNSDYQTRGEVSFAPSNDTYALLIQVTGLIELSTGGASGKESGSTATMECDVNIRIGGDTTISPRNFRKIGSTARAEEHRMIYSDSAVVENPTNNDTPIEIRFRDASSVDRGTTGEFAKATLADVTLSVLEIKR